MTDTTLRNGGQLLMIAIESMPEARPMSDVLYVECSVPLDMRPLFSQLKTEFPEHELWVRKENFGRTVLAAVVNPHRGIAVTVPVSRPGFIRTRGLEAIELGRLRSHLAIGSEDLAFA